MAMYDELKFERVGPHKIVVAVQHVMGERDGGQGFTLNTRTFGTIKIGEMHQSFDSTWQFEPVLDRRVGLDLSQLTQITAKIERLNDPDRPQPDRLQEMFAISYGFNTWVVCYPDGGIREAFDGQFPAELHAELLNWMASV